MKRVTLKVSGHVIGVSYREFVMMEARKLNLLGYVKNLPDATVEVVAEGEEQKLKDLIKACYKGSFKARVMNIDINYSEPTQEFEGFVVEF